MCPNVGNVSPIVTKTGVMKGLRHESVERNCASVLLLNAQKKAEDRFLLMMHGVSF